MDSLSTVEALASASPRWSTMDDAVSRFLLALSSRTQRYMAQLAINPETDYPLVPVRDASEYSDLWNLAAAMGLANAELRRITPEGWKRVEALRSTAALTRQAFVAMSFAPEMRKAWTAGFKPGIETSKFFTALRIDQKEFNNKIDDQIVAEIRRSGLVVADFTGHRGGVYFEAGFALGLGIPLIWTCRDTDIGAAHFDTRQYNHIVWSTPQDLATQLDRRIRASILPLVSATA